MDLTKIHDAYREALGAFHGLRKLGFASEDIFFVACAITGTRCVQVLVELHAQGKTFDVSCGMLEGKTQDEVCKEWTAIAATVNGEHVNQKQLKQLWKKSMVYKDFIDFSMTLIAKGFMLPKIVS